MLDEWISVEDKLPESNGDVTGSGDVLIVFRDRNGKYVISIGEYYPYTGVWLLYYGDIHTTDTGHCEVTHWRPLPELPK